ncbi:hypothetical protein DIPPA_25130 [Diplonema papillatum]|nr:hypothetical protein DIPPA_25130 [Diplonema papillatum]
MSLRHLSVSIIAGLFGGILISTGNAVYNIGHERLRHASEEQCTMTERKERSCSYECGAFLSASRNCTGHSFVYSALAAGKCEDKALVFDEYEELKSKGIMMCRCGKDKPGDCWVDLPGFLPRRSYPCTVNDDCKKFDLSSPSDYITTGLVNMLLGVCFLMFACCPDSCLLSIGTCLTACVGALIPAVTACNAAFLLFLKTWLDTIRNFTEAPAKRYTKGETTPLI